MSDERTIHDPPMLAVNRNREGAILAVAGPYTGDHARLAAEMYVSEHGGEPRGWKVEEFTNQRAVTREPAISDRFTIYRCDWILPAIGAIPPRRCGHIQQGAGDCPYAHPGPVALTAVEVVEVPS